MTAMIPITIGKRKFAVKDCAGLASFRGLMFDKIEKYDGALIHANEIWMPFVKQKLNLIFLDKDMRVLEQRLAVPLSLNPRSWKTYRNSSAKYCLELKDTKLTVKKGTKIEL